MVLQVLVEGLGSAFLVSHTSTLNQIQLVFYILNWFECLDRLWDKFNFQNLIFERVKMLAHSSLKVYVSYNIFWLVNTSFLALSLKCDLMYSALITILNIYLSWYSLQHSTTISQHIHVLNLISQSSWAQH